MKKRWLFCLLVMLLFSLSFTGCTEEVEKIDYDVNVNYLVTALRAADEGDAKGIIDALEKRDAMIDDGVINREKISPNELLKRFEEFTGFRRGEDYTQIMIDCCVEGDLENGRIAAEKRNKKIELFELKDKQIDFDELFMFSKIISAEAGSSWIPMDWKMMVGEVLLNRVDSLEFPNTLEGCIYQTGQYECVISGRFEVMRPRGGAVEAAVRLMNGERILNDPSVVFQSNFKQGSGVHLILHDEILGDTYLCYSNRPHLYKEEADIVE